MKSVSPLSTAWGCSGIGSEVVDEDRDRLGRVARRLERDEPHASELDGVAVGERRERVLRLGPGAEVDPRPDAVAELEMAGEEIRVEVREEDVLDPAAEGSASAELLGTATRTRFADWSSRFVESFTRTATACSAPCTTQRTPTRRSCSAPGER